MKKLGDDHPDVAMTYNNMAIVYKKQGKYEEALAMYEKALSIKLKKLGDDHPSVAMTFENIGLLYDEKLNKYKEALDFYQKALKIRKAKLETNTQRPKTMRFIAMCEAQV